MNLTAAEGSHWETADGKLMLRHSMKSVNDVLCSHQKTCGSGQGREVERPDAAQVRSLRVPPPAEGRGPGSKNEVFCWRVRATRVRGGSSWEVARRRFFNENTKRMTQQLRLAEANKARRNENR